MSKFLYVLGGLILQGLFLIVCLALPIVVVLIGVIIPSASLRNVLADLLTPIFPIMPILGVLAITIVVIYSAIWVYKDSKRYQSMGHDDLPPGVWAFVTFMFWIPALTIYKYLRRYKYNIQSA